MEDDLKKRIVTSALRMFVMDDTADSYERKLRYEEDPMARASLSVEYARARAEALAAKLYMREACIELEDIYDA